MVESLCDICESAGMIFDTRSEAALLFNQLFSQEEHFADQNKLIRSIQESMKLKSLPKLSTADERQNFDDKNMAPFD